MIYIAYAVAWIATAVAVIFGIKLTGSAWCLCAFFFPAGISLSHNKKTDNNDEADRHDKDE